MDSSEDEYHDISDSYDEYTDDSSGEDPDYDVIKKTTSTFSNMSLKRKIKPRTVKGTDEDEEDVEVEETVGPELSNEDQKSYETILTMVEGGQVEKLKIDQCKIYLRKHKLRLAGNKATLIQRIKEHINIVNVGGEKQYPVSSFVLNCKGDACMGDIVMFEQNVYEMFNLASRSATGPPCGKRVVAGRIIKESYGAAKQQHTFTVEVLWSKGEKPLPPLHPLLIKGRNLYKLKTLRQKWEDEGEREKILLEKHSRGDLARCHREARIEKREMRKMINADRGTRKQNKENTGPVRSTNPEKQINEAKEQQQDLVSNLEDQRFKHKTQRYSKASGSNLINQGNYYRQPIGISNTIVPPPELLYQRQQFVRTSDRGFYTGPVSSFQPANLRGMQINNINNMMNLHCVHPDHGNAAQRQHVQAQDYKQKQMCRYYAQGRCHFGDRCKFLHEVSGDKS